MLRFTKHLCYHFFLLALVPFSLSAQKGFEGIVSYEIELKGENAGQFAHFMPRAYEYKIRNNLIRFHMEGGMTAALMGDILIDTKKGEAFMIKEAEKIAYRIQEEGESPAKPLIEASDETLPILGYPCRKYKVTTPGAAGATVQYVWATPDIQIENLQKRNAKFPSGAGQLLIEGLNGFPLKIMTTLPEGGLILIMTATRVELQRIGKSDMEIPKDFDIRDFDPNLFGGY